MTKLLEGITAALVTPYDETENLNETAFGKIINYLIDSGIHGLFSVGSQGEFFSLTKNEKKRLIEVAIEEASAKAFVMPNTG